jgi:hypothetical protein
MPSRAGPDMCCGWCGLGWQVPLSLHLWESGVHGAGLGNRNHPQAPLLPWTQEALRFLRQYQFAQSDPNAQP